MKLRKDYYFLDMWYSFLLFPNKQYEFCATFLTMLEKYMLIY